MLSVSRAADACGGCFHPEDQPPEQASVVMSHRMALAISSTQTVLWDQVQYAGSPAEFAWVLPVKPGAYLEIASDAWFEALDATTTPRVVPPALACSMSEPDYVGCSTPTTAAAGCSADGTAGADAEDVNIPPPDPVTVIHEGSVGPYETVTIHSDVPGALPAWLIEHGFAIEEDIAPILEAYAAEGFDFIALRLAPMQGIQQMKPVRVVQQGAVPTLPLRMVAAGTGASVALTLFVIGEGRWEVANFPNVLVDPALVSWSFATQSSNYAGLRSSAMTEDGGRGWLTSYAQPGALLSPVPDPTTGGATRYFVGATATTTIAAAFVEQAIANGEGNDRTCLAAVSVLAESADRVVEPCPAWSDGCVNLEPGQVSAEELVCKGPFDTALDDLAVAMTGLHPRDVWVTRLDANLPRAALGEDLLLAPTLSEPVSGWVQAERAWDAPCPLANATAAKGAPRSTALSTVGLALAISSILRRAFRRRAA